MGNKEVPLASVDRALRLILLLRKRGSLSVSEAAAELDVTPPTAYRLLAALKKHDFAAQDPNRRYREGSNLISHTTTLLSPRMLRKLLRPELIAAQAQLNETVNLWILEGMYVRNFDGIESNQELAVRVNAYDRIPAYCSAAGKALLAGLTNQEVEQMHFQGLPKWRSQRVTNMSELKRVLQTARQVGYATNLQEASQGVCGVGVAIHSPDGSALVAMSCGVPSTRFSAQRRKEIAAVLQSSAQKMAEILKNSEPI